MFWERERMIREGIVNKKAVYYHYIKYLLIFSCRGTSQIAVSASLWLSMWQGKYCNRDKWCHTAHTVWYPTEIMFYHINNFIAL